MKRREWLAYFILIPILLFYVFFPESQSQDLKEKKRVTIHDDFYTLLGAQTESWRFINKEVDLEGLERYRQIYEKNKHFQFQSGPDFRIPKYIHFIWVGPKNFPRESIENVRTWLAHHPDWTLVFWTDRPRPVPVQGMETRYIQDFEFTALRKYYEEASNWAEKSDILRYEILYQLGGIYVDHDANCLKPFHGLNCGYDFFACLELPHSAVDQFVVTAGIGIIGSKPGHPVIKGCIDLIKDRWEKVTNTFRSLDPGSQRERVLHRTYIAMTHSLNEHLDRVENRDIVFPASYFYAKQPLPSIYSKHFYGGKWEKSGKLKGAGKLGSELKELKVKLKQNQKSQAIALLLLLGCFFLVYRIWRRFPHFLALLVLVFLLPGCKKSKQTLDEFSQLMGEGKEAFQFVETLEDQTRLDQFRNQYFRIKDVRRNRSTKIPKIIHFVWFGPASLSSAYSKNIKSWIKHHPDWTFYFWSDRARSLPHSKLQLRNIQFFQPEHFKEEFVEARHYREKADLLRLEILKKIGGVCVDIDMDCRRSFESLLENYDFFCSTYPLTNPLMGSTVFAFNGLVGAIKEHPIIEKAIVKTQDSWEGVQSFFPFDDSESNLYRITYRIFIPFDDAVRNCLEDRKYANIVLPAGFFFDLDGDYGIYATHKYGLSWLDGISKEDRIVKKGIASIEKKNNQMARLNSFLLLLSCMLFLLLLYLYHWLRTHENFPRHTKGS